MTSLYKTT